MNKNNYILIFLSFIIIFFLAVILTNISKSYRNYPPNDKITEQPINLYDLKAPIVTDESYEIPQQNLISFNFGRIDTRNQDPAIQYLKERDYALLIIQVNDPKSYDDFLSEIANLGGSKINYLPYYSYLFYVPTNVIDDIQNLEQFNWMGWYYPEYKTTLKDNEITTQNLTILIHEKQVTQTVKQLAQMGKANNDYRCWREVCTLYGFILGNNFKVSDLTKIDSVIWIEEQGIPTLN